MWRTLPVCALLFVLTSICWGDDKAPDPNTTVIRLKLKPMAAPKPALKYQLLPELREMNPGNPILEYLRCFPQQHNFWNTKQSIENRDKWEKMPLKELPQKEMRHGGYGGGNPLRRADRAARLDTPDWQILLQLKREGIHLLLPEVQSLREMASALKVRFRLEIAERRFDDALVTAKTMLALSRHLGEHPTAIGDLVGLAIGHLTIGHTFFGLGPLDEMIQQPGCPNLFWALTDLPSPFIDIRKGVQGERTIMMKEFALLDEQNTMSEAQLQKAVDRLCLLIKVYNIKKDVPDWLNKLARDENRVRGARKRLIESGLVANTVNEFPALQVILLDEKLEYELRRDEMTKGMALPYWQAKRYFRLGKRFEEEREDTLLAGFTPVIFKVKESQTRLDQRIALLRCVEALRIYAAEHDGKLPAKLEDIDLPLPVDPATGKSFYYNVDGNTAHLDGARLIIQVRYEVTMEK